MDSTPREKPTENDFAEAARLLQEDVNNERYQEIQKQCGKRKRQDEKVNETIKVKLENEKT